MESRQSGEHFFSQLKFAGLFEPSYTVWLGMLCLSLTGHTKSLEEGNVRADGKEDV